MNLTAKQQSPISFEQYVSGKFDCPWSDCRWVEGALVQVPLESGQNNAIARYLFFQFKLHAMQQGLVFEVCMKDTDIEVDSTTHQTRKPDVMVISQTLDQALRGQSSVIRKTMEPPLLIVEVISKNYRNVDLIEKEQEYCDRQVPEYWTIDWDRPDPVITLRTLSNDSRCYVPQNYFPGERVQSHILPDLTLRVDDILAASLNLG